MWSILISQCDVLDSCSDYDLEAMPLERQQVTVISAYDLQVYASGCGLYGPLRPGMHARGTLLALLWFGH